MAARKEREAMAARLDILRRGRELGKYGLAPGTGERTANEAKSKGEVSGGGKKPWRQKGTGRARAGSTPDRPARGLRVADAKKTKKRDRRVSVSRRHSTSQTGKFGAAGLMAR